MVRTTKVIHGDALEVLRAIPSGITQIAVHDGPDGKVLKERWDNQWHDLEEYLDGNLASVSECMRVLAEDGLCFFFGQVGKRQHAFLHLSSLLCRHLQFHDRLIWDRVIGYHERRDSLTPAYEEILVLRKSVAVKFRKSAVRIPYDTPTIERYSRDKRYADRKARMKHLLKGKFVRNLSTDPGDLVLDPFLGSGTTAVAARQLGRSCIGIEKEANYCHMAERRLAAAPAGPISLGTHYRMVSLSSAGSQHAVPDLHYSTDFPAQR